VYDGKRLPQESNPPWVRSIASGSVLIEQPNPLFVRLASGVSTILQYQLFYSAVDALTVYWRCRATDPAADIGRIAIDINSGATLVREGLLSNSSGNRVFFIANAGTVQVDWRNWHEFRMRARHTGAGAWAFDGYIDENNTPFMSGSATPGGSPTTSDNIIFYMNGDAVDAVPAEMYLSGLAFNLKGAFSPAQYPKPGVCGDVIAPCIEPSKIPAYA
jgi:hypothetical protein